MRQALSAACHMRRESDAEIAPNEEQLDFRNLYGTLFDAGATPTHVVCPICGKSSSVKSFPAGRGNEIMYQTFQGMGRGKGFAVVSRESALDDRSLATALKPKLLELVSALAGHGHITRLEILNSVGGAPEPEAVSRTASADLIVRRLEDQLVAEKKTRDFLEREVTDLQLGVTRMLKQWRDAERQNARAQRQLNELRARKERLVVATRDVVESLQRLRSELKNEKRGAAELADHVRHVRAIVESVQSLHVSQRTEPREVRGDHDAR